MQLASFKNSFHTILFVAIVALSLGSCTKNMVFSKYESIEDAKWHKDSIISFTINSTDTISKNNIYLSLRNNEEYEFSNLFLIVGIKFPNNYQSIDTLEYEMTTPEGYFLGSGMTDIKENKLEYRTNVVFPIKGDYHIQIQHAMRKTRNVDGILFLDGITDVGVQIEKAN